MVLQAKTKDKPARAKKAAGNASLICTGCLEDGRAQARATPAKSSIAALGYLTPQDEFGAVERGNPLPYTLPLARRREVGLERETWRLEVVADPDSDTKLERPLTVEAGSALDFAGLMRLARSNAVQYLKGITCLNLGEPLGMGLWEGVPLRCVVSMVKPVANVRRVFYYGYHNDDPSQRFQSSLPFSRVLEDPPGELPVLLCYKLNGAFLTGKRGGPVRMIVPEAYGFKCVKWLQRIVLTNDYKANDTYALGNNDIESPMKTFARFSKVPSKARAGKPITITGLAQVGISGLAKVQYCLRLADPPSSNDDLNLTQGDWVDADILPFSRDWARRLSKDHLARTPLQFDPKTEMPRQWPMRYTMAHWKAVLLGADPGRYELHCRTIDLNGIAQPMPRPFAKSGQTAIQKALLFIGE
jgi:DMSO/TMAO reductase YedYZ molybdopterin-dependent catalytic subunit